MVAEVGEVAVVVVAGTVAAAAVVVTLLPTQLLLETTDAGRRVASTYCPFQRKILRHYSTERSFGKTAFCRVIRFYDRLTAFSVTAHAIISPISLINLDLHNAVIISYINYSPSSRRS